MGERWLFFRLGPSTLVGVSFFAILGAQQPPASLTTTARQDPPLNRIVLFNRAGLRQPTFIEPGNYSQIDLSPDDARLIVERKNGDSTKAGSDQPMDLWLADLASRSFTRWTANFLNPRDPVWSPDSQSVVYRVASGRGGPDLRPELRQVTVGSSDESILSASSEVRYPDDWATSSGGGTFLLYHTDNPDTVAVLALTARVKTRFLATGRIWRRLSRLREGVGWVGC